MSLIEITESTHNIVLDMRYATPNNFTGEIIYPSKRCFIHKDMVEKLEDAIKLAAHQNLRLKILDAYRPQSAQEKLWSVCPNPNYVMPPEKGSTHTRGIAVDITLINKDGQELDMGSPFDSFEEISHHGSYDISARAAANRYMLLGIMLGAGWDLYKYEWWHYQAHNVHTYPLIPNHSFED